MQQLSPLDETRRASTYGAEGTLALELDAYRKLFNEVRPHEHLNFATPHTAYFAARNPTYPRHSVQET